MRLSLFAFPLALLAALSPGSSATRVDVERENDLLKKLNSATSHLVKAEQVGPSSSPRRFLCFRAMRSVSRPMLCTTVFVACARVQCAVARRNRSSRSLAIFRQRLAPPADAAVPPVQAAASAQEERVEALEALLEMKGGIAKRQEDTLNQLASKATYVPRIAALPCAAARQGRMRLLQRVSDSQTI